MAVVAKGGNATGDGGGRRRGCCFGPPSVGGLVTFSGSRWKLWSEQEATAEVTHSDPSEAYTAVCWGAGTQCLALGCASGRVQAWDPYAAERLGPTAEAFHAVARGADCSVTALAAADPARSSVFAGCAAVPEILEIGVVDGVTRRSLSAGKAGIGRLAASISASADFQWLLAAGASASALKVWCVPKSSASTSVATEKIPVNTKLAGPSNPSSCLDLFPLSSETSPPRILALCVDSTTQIDVFSVDRASSDVKAGRDTLGAALVLSSHEQIHGAHFSSSLTSDGKMNVVGYGPSIVSCWTFHPDLSSGSKESRKTIPAAYTVSAEDLGNRVLHARIVLHPKMHIVAAFGAAAHPAFAAVRPPASAGVQATIEPLSATASQQTLLAKAGVAAKQPTVLGPLEGTVPRVQPRRKRLAEEMDQPVDGSAAKDLKLEFPQGARASSGLSMAPVVRQALRAKDGQSMDKVLQTCEKRVVDSTIAELTGAEAFDTLQECTKRLMTQPIRAPILSLWIQRVLIRHYGFIHSQPVLRGALQPLVDAFEARVCTHRELVRLQGRLQMAQKFGRQLLEKRKQEKENVFEPLLVYTEGDEDAAEEESSSDADEGGADEDNAEEGEEESDDMFGSDDEL